MAHGKNMKNTVWLVGGGGGGTEGCDPNASAEGKCAVVQRAESTKCAYGPLQRKYSTSKAFQLAASSLKLNDTRSWGMLFANSWI
jgi:hypothetical protein